MVTKNWDIFDILFAHEDSYTNLMQYLFENSKEFYEKFSKLLFGKVVNGLEYVTRTAFITDSGKRNIPDIVVYNKDYLAMVEVKVYASEGSEQTKRYYESIETIKDKKEINQNCTERFYYLTLWGTAPAFEKFKPISWLEIGKCLPENSFETPETELLVKHFKRRIESLLPKTVSENDKWCEVVKTKYWGGARGLYDALKTTPSFKPLPDNMCDYWGSFKTSKNKYTYSALFLMKPCWKGCSVEEADKHPKDCYEYHFEFEWDEKNRLLEIRLDYHLNPYKSNSDLKKEENENIKSFAQEANTYRAQIARTGKKYWKKYMPEDWKDAYNGHITDSVLQLASKYIKIDKDHTVAQVTEQIEAFVKSAVRFVDEVMLPLQNEK